MKRSSNSSSSRNHSRSSRPRPASCSTNTLSGKQDNNNLPSNHHTNTFSVDLSSLCNAAARGDVLGVKKCLLYHNRNPHCFSGKEKLEKCSVSTSIADLDGGEGNDHELSAPIGAALALHELLFLDHDKGSQNLHAVQGENLCAVDDTAKNYIRNSDDNVSRYFVNYEDVWERPGMALRALLLLPPWSQTPWNAAQATVSCIQQKVGIIGYNALTMSSHFLSYLAEVQTFLSSVSTPTCCGRDIASVEAQSVELQKLFRLVLDALLVKGIDAVGLDKICSGDTNSIDNSLSLLKGGSMSSYDNRRQVLPLDLLPSILSAADRIDNNKLLEQQRKCNMGWNLDDDTPKHKMGTRDKMMRLLFPKMTVVVDRSKSKLQNLPLTKILPDFRERRIKSDMVLPLLSIVSDIRPWMTLNYWSCLRKIIFQALYPGSSDQNMGNRDVQTVPPADFPGLVRGVLNLMSTVAGGRIFHDSNHDEPRDADNAYPKSTHAENEHDLPSPYPQWEELLLHIYHASSIHKMTVSTVESVLKSTLTNLPLRISMNIVSAVVEMSADTRKNSNMSNSPYKVPQWVCSNVLLIILHSQKCGPYVVYDLISDAIGTASTSVGIDVVRSCLRAMLDISTSHCKNGSYCDDDWDFVLELKDVKSYLRGACYKGNGDAGYHGPHDLSNNDNDSIKACHFLFSSYVKLIRSSLFLGLKKADGATYSDDNCIENHSSERAHMWVNAAYTLLDMKGRNDKYGKKIFYKGAILSIAIMTVIFWDVPSSRPTLVRNIVGNICNSQNPVSVMDVDMRLIYCLLVSAIARTITYNDYVNGKNTNNEVSRQMLTITDDERHSMLSIAPISDLLASSNIYSMLPTNLILELVTALSRLQSGREAILAMVKKFAKSPFGTNSFWFMHFHGETAYSGHERMNLALEGMFILIRIDPFERNSMLGKTETLDPAGLEALESITDLIVLNKPPLPLRVRKSILHRLVEMVKEECLNYWIKERILNASLFVLLRYFRLLKSSEDIGNQSEGNRKVKMRAGDIEFVPEICFSGWNSLNSLSSSDTSKELTSTEDLPNIIRLVLSIIQHNESKTKAIVPLNFEKNVHSKPTTFEVTSEKEINMILDILSKTKGIYVKNNNSNTNVLSEFDGVYDATQFEFKTDSLQFSRSLASFCIGSIVIYLVRKVEILLARNGRNDIQVLNSDFKSCTALQKNLIRGEVQAWQKVLSNHSSGWHSPSRILPSWTRVVPSENVVSLSIDVNSREFESTCRILSSLCSIVSNFLLKSECARHSKDAVNGNLDQNQVRLSMGVSVLLDIRRKLILQNYQTGKDNGERKDEDSAIFHVEDKHDYFSIQRFLFCAKNTILNEFSCARKTIKLVDVEGYDFDRLIRVNLILLASLDFCNYIHILSQKTKSFDVCQVVTSLWHLYRGIVSETGCRSLIAFLESQCLREMNHERVSSIFKHSGFSLTTIKSQDDIDYCVRHIRWSILSSMKSAFECIPKSNRQHLLNTRGTFTTVSLMTYLRVVCSLCQDLCSGLLGCSGGITISMYRLYIAVIEECSKAIHNADDANFTSSLSDHGGKLVLELRKMCMTASITLWNALCIFDINYANVFKSTLLISVWHLPRILRRIDRLCLFLPCTFDELGSRPDSEESLAAVMMGQCLCILQSQSASKKFIKTEKEFANDCDNNEEGETEVCIEKYAILSKEQESGDDTSSLSEAVPSRGAKLRISSKKLWDWACCCSLLAAERTLMESYELVNSFTHDPRLKGLLSKVEQLSHKDDVDPINKIKQYASKRMTEVASILRNINLLFNQTRPDFHQDGNGECSHEEIEMNIPASFLSQAGKKRLCFCLERIALTFKNALRFAARYKKMIQNAQSNSPLRLCSGTTRYTDLLLIESIACLLAWLCPKLQKPPTDDFIDFVEGIKRWYDIERKNEFKWKNSLKRKQQIKNAYILARMPKVLFRIEELEIALQKFQNYLKEDKNTNDPYRGEEVLNNILNHLIADRKIIDKRDSKASKKSFCWIIDEYLAHLTAIRSKSQASKSFYDIENEKDSSKECSDNELYSGKDKRSKNNISLQRPFHKSRKEVLRSRNGVVDEWLELDRDLGEGIEDDAYIDLEDFLVEG